MSEDRTTFKIISQQEKFACPVFTVFEEELVFQEERSLSAKNFTRYIVKHPGASVFLPLTKDKKLLLVTQFRAPIRARLLEAPAGTLEKDEEPLECAKREIQEEVGVKADEWISLGELYPAPGFCDEKQHLYLAKGLSASKLPGDDDEDIEVVESSIEEVEEQISSGQIVDAKTIAAFTRAKLRGLFS